MAIGSGNSKSAWILITGATSGIGRDCIAPLIQSGFCIIATGRNQDELNYLQDTFKDKITTFAADLFSSDSIDALLNFVEEHLDSRPQDFLFAVFNNAGLAYSSPLECTTSEALREQLDINLHSVHQITRRLIPRLQATPSGLKPRILFTGSVSGHYAFPLLGPYSISKFALKAYADALRVELRHAEIFVSLLELGPVKTAIWERSKTDSARRQSTYKTSHGEMNSVYQTGSDRLLNMVEKIDNKALPVETVSKKIMSIMLAKNPPIYWMPLRDKISVVLMKIAPTRLVDFIADRTLFR